MIDFNSQLQRLPVRRSTLLTHATKMSEREAQALCARTDVCKDAPADLADEMPHFLSSETGARPGSRLLPADLGCGRASPAFALALSAVLPILLGAVSGGAGKLIWIALIWIPVSILIARLYLFRSAAKIQGENYPGEGDLAREINREINAKRQQIERAKTDRSAFFELGISTNQIGGLYGADRNRKLGLSEHDLSTHMFVFGATGSGKTSGLLRPLASWWAKGNGGMLVSDGKGDLPREFDGRLRGYRLLVPGRDYVDLLAGLEPHDVVAALSAAAPASDDNFWNSSASELIYHAAVVSQRTQKYYLLNISRLLNDAKFRAGDCLELARRLVSEDRVLERSLSFFANFDDKSNTAASILATANAMLNELLRHADLLPWASGGTGGTGINIVDVLRGARYGIDVSSARYGAAAVAVTALLRAQIYRAALTRGSNHGQNTCLVLIDEAAIALGELEQQILPVARSLGLSFACATQNLEQFEARFGPAGSRALVDQFRSLICLNASDQTQQYVQQRAGAGVKSQEPPARALSFTAILRREATSLSPTRPLSHELRFLTDGIRRSVFGMRELDDLTLTRTISIGPLFDEKQAVPLADGEALCVLNRANFKRVETIELNRQFD